MKKVLVLAGGYDQIALIEEYRERGFQTVLVDYFENPPAKSYADKHYQISTLDINAVKKVAMEEKVDLVMTACTDQALVTMAKVSEELSLPCYLTYDVACKVTNKLLMKKIMLDNNIPTAKFKIASVFEKIEEMQYPMVVKPADANSSKGVERVYNDIELQDAVKKAKGFSRQGEVIIEEYKSGEELSVDVWVEDYKPSIMCISQSLKIKDEKKFTIVQSKYPCQVNSKDEDKILAVLSNIAIAFNVRRGPLLVQLIKGDDEINIIEFSARYGGGTKYKLIEAVSGINPMKAIVDLSLGENKLINISRTKRYYHMNYVYCNPGKIREFCGFDEAKSKGLIDDYFYYKTPGMLIEKIENSSDRAAGYMVSGETVEELLHREKKAEEMIKVISEDGKNIIRGMLYE